MSRKKLGGRKGVSKSTESVKLSKSALSRVTIDIRAAINLATPLYHELK